ncbi:MAG: SpoIVB peptidase [Oscillospiraceae bacterium]|nr:SpoIVB peptidase [Oscillospiraceae bacterium]
MKTAARILVCLMVVAAMGLGSLLLYLHYGVSDHYILWEGEELPLQGGSLIDRRVTQQQNGYSIELVLPGGIPAKTVQVDIDQRRMLVPSGAPFGVKMFTRGVIVVGFSDITANGQRQNPARKAGLEAGDVILEIDGEPVNGNRMLGQKVAASHGEPLQLLVQRDERQMMLPLFPVFADNDNTWRAGIWVRDSSAGIGTMTYWDPATGDFAGLGHPICDVDTGELMPLSNGQIVGVEITGLEKGECGDPGELQGSFINDELLGELTDNTETGIYGQVAGGDADYFGSAEALPVASAQEVQPGPAVIYTTISGSVPQQYSIEIEKVSSSSHTTRNMVIHVTDPQLLTATGGILQGMSGSPIIQDSKLIGAVTHVLVNDPTRGYGIFIENMLDAAG